MKICYGEKAVPTPAAMNLYLMFFYQYNFHVDDPCIFDVSIFDELCLESILQLFLGDW